MNSTLEKHLNRLDQGHPAAVDDDSAIGRQGGREQGQRDLHPEDYRQTQRQQGDRRHDLHKLCSRARPAKPRSVGLTAMKWASMRTRGSRSCRFAT